MILNMLREKYQLIIPLACNLFKHILFIFGKTVSQRQPQIQDPPASVSQILYHIKKKY